MWPWTRTTTRKRRELRKPLPGELTRWERFRQGGGIAGVLLAGGFYLAVALLDCIPLDPMPYRPGQYIGHEVYSRTPFKLISPDKLRRELDLRRETTPATFTLDAAALDALMGPLEAMPERLRPATQPAEVPQALREQWAVTPEALAAWRRYIDPPAHQRFMEQAAQLRKDLQRTPVAARQQVEDQQGRKSTSVVLSAGGQRQSVNVGDLVPAERITQERALKLASSFDPALREGIAKHLMAMFTTRPLYVLDAAASQKDIDAAVEALSSRPPEDVHDVYKKGQLLVSAGVRLGPSELALLRQEHRSAMADQERTAFWQPWLRLGGRLAVLGVIATLLVIYVARHDASIIRYPGRAGAIGILLTGVLLAAKLVSATVWAVPVAVLGVMLTSFVLTIAYQQRFALVLSTILSALIVLLLRSDLWCLLLLVAAATAVALQIRDVRSRTRLIKVSGLATAVLLAVGWAAGLAQGMPPGAIVDDSLRVAVLALLAGFVVQGLLPLLERFFGVATSMTLLEWCDASRPLLKRLAMEAPGTFSHSLQLGAIAEAAAEAIGARGLLARAGAYYHDVGKINKPDYFVENQLGGTNRHARLSPAMSLLIVTGHVRDGLELAREYGLPPVLHEFIASHHGTTLVQYFYNAAAEQRKAESERAPDEVEFRYTGPKPRSREAGILMLADACESSVRAMSDPTPGRIENQVHAMVMRRLMDGQLDDCGITLQQVHLAEASITKSLIGIYHTRVAYPTPSGERASAAETPSSRRGAAAG
jgi:putative nucleotidyltransferase with HDIG domain